MNGIFLRPPTGRRSHAARMAWVSGAALLGTALGATIIRAFSEGQQPARPRRRDPKLDYYPESRFGDFSDIDQLVVFYTRVHALLQPSYTVLEIGCGRG